mmetsp:Transcript_39595/g.53818  ORF Transcript_39595/g.53818 Transcript_39595/m.53818 type:complete len:207 (-) Transcript_39595:676-1296(-)
MCAPVTSCEFSRTATSAASFTMVAKCAPDKLHVCAAIRLESMPAPLLTFLRWTSRIASRADWSGKLMISCRSNRRRSAASITSALLVAPMTSTGLSSLMSNPSISVSSWLSVCSRSSFELTPPRIFARASSSSTKIIAGAESLALRNRSRTRAAPRPTNDSTNSLPVTEKNRTPASLERARARSVLPVPGGPERSRPRGSRAPMSR